MISFTHLSTPVEVLSFHSSCNAFTSCLILISIANNVNVKFGVFLCAYTYKRQLYSDLIGCFVHGNLKICQVCELG